MSRLRSERGSAAGRIQLALFGLVVAYAALLPTSFIVGTWLVDQAGLSIPTDYLNVWAAGRLVLAGRAADAYDWGLHKAVEVQGLGHDFADYFGWHYPPPFLLLAGPLSLLPYIPSLLAWMALTLPVYLAAIRLAAGRTGTLVPALAFPAGLLCLVVGQNGFLTTGLLGLALAVLPARPVLAGILIGCLSYKPQFGVLIPIALAAGGYWRAFASAAAATILLAVLSALVLGGGVWIAFFHSLALTNSALLEEGRAGFDKLQSVFGFVRWMGGGVAVAWTAQAALIVGAMAGTAWLWRSRQIPYGLRAAGLTALAPLATPYLYVYDLLLLALPIAFLARGGLGGVEQAVVALAGALLLVFPFTSGPVGLLAACLVAGLVLRRVVVARRTAPAEMRRDPSFAPVAMRA